MRYAVILLGILSTLPLAPAIAQNSPATAPTSQPSLINSDDKQQLQSNIGKLAIVQGTITDAKWSPSGRVFLIKFDTEADGFQGAIFAKNKEAMEKALKGDLSTALEGAKVQIVGKLQTFKEHPEILIDIPAQIIVLAKAPNPSQPATTQPSTPPSQ